MTQHESAKTKSFLCLL